MVSSCNIKPSDLLKNCVLPWNHEKMFEKQVKQCSHASSPPAGTCMVSHCNRKHWLCLLGRLHFGCHLTTHLYVCCHCNCKHCLRCPPALLCACAAARDPVSLPAHVFPPTAIANTGFAYWVDKISPVTSADQCNRKHWLWTLG